MRRASQASLLLLQSPSTDLLVHRVVLARQVNTAVQVLSGSLDPEVSRANRAALFLLQKPSSLDHRDHLDLLGLKEPWDNRDTKENRVNLACRAALGRQTLGLASLVAGVHRGQRVDPDLKVRTELQGFQDSQVFPAVLLPITSKDPLDPQAHLEEMGQVLVLWTWASMFQSTCNVAM